VNSRSLQEMSLCRAAGRDPGNPHVSKGIISAAEPLAATAVFESSTGKAFPQDPRGRNGNTLRLKGYFKQWPGTRQPQPCGTELLSMIARDVWIKGEEREEEG